MIMNAYSNPSADKEAALISRLRAEKADFESANYDEGFEFGADWAEEHGDFRMFVQLEVKADEFASEEEWASYLDSQEDLYDWIAGQIQNESSFHKCHVGARAMYSGPKDGKFFPGYLRGFVDGILITWDTVKEKVIA